MPCGTKLSFNLISGHVERRRASDRKRGHRAAWIRWTRDPPDQIIQHVA